MPSATLAASTPSGPASRPRLKPRLSTALASLSSLRKGTRAPPPEPTPPPPPARGVAGVVRTYAQLGARQTVLRVPAVAPARLSPFSYVAHAAAMGAGGAGLVCGGEGGDAACCCVKVPVGGCGPAEEIAVGLDRKGGSRAGKVGFAHGKRPAMLRPLKEGVYDLRMGGGAHAEIRAAAERVFLYVYRGAVRVAGERVVHEGCLVLMEEVGGMEAAERKVVVETAVSGAGESVCGDSGEFAQWVEGQAGCYALVLCGEKATEAFEGEAEDSWDVDATWPSEKSVGELRDAFKEFDV